MLFKAQRLLTHSFSSPSITIQFRLRRLQWQCGPKRFSPNPFRLRSSRTPRTAMAHERWRNFVSLADAWSYHAGHEVHNKGYQSAENCHVESLIDTLALYGICAEGELSRRINPVSDVACIPLLSRQTIASHFQYDSTKNSYRTRTYTLSEPGC